MGYAIAISDVKDSINTMLQKNVSKSSTQSSYYYSNNEDDNSSSPFDFWN